MGTVYEAYEKCENCGGPSWILMSDGNEDAIVYDCSCHQDIKVSEDDLLNVGWRWGEIPERVNWEDTQQEPKQVEASLKFYLPDNKDEYDSAINGHNYKSALWAIFQHLYKLQKWPPDSMSEDTYALLYQLYDEITEIMTNGGYNPWEDD